MLNLSKKHMILYRAHCDIEARIRKGEQVPFTFEFNERLQLKLLQVRAPSSQSYSICASITTTLNGSCKQSISIVKDENKLIIESKQIDSDTNDDEHGEQKEPPPPPPSSSSSGRRRRSSRRLAHLVALEESPLPSDQDDQDDDCDNDSQVCCKRQPTSKQSSSLSLSTLATQGEQTECSISGCSNSVTNRLRFSLRCHKPEDFKESFIQMGWNKVCHYHYFSDLYKYKKMSHGGNKGKQGKRSQTGRKRNHKEEEEDYGDDNDETENNGESSEESQGGNYATRKQDRQPMCQSEGLLKRKRQKTTNSDLKMFCSFIDAANSERQM